MSKLKRITTKDYHSHEARKNIRDGLLYSFAAAATGVMANAVNEFHWLPQIGQDLAQTCRMDAPHAFAAIAAVSFALAAKELNDKRKAPDQLPEEFRKHLSSAHSIEI